MQNPGIDHFLATELPWLAQRQVRVFVSIVGRSLGEYAELARRLGRSPGVAGIEVNLSAPDAPGTHVFDVREPFHAASVVAAVHRDLPRGMPMLAKIRSDVVRVVESARTVLDAGAGAVVVGNALPASMPDGRPGRAERAGDPAARAALRRRGARRGPGGADRRRRVASSTPTTSARSSTPARPPSRSAPPCCTTPPPPPASWPTLGEDR